MQSTEKSIFSYWVAPRNINNTASMKNRDIAVLCGLFLSKWNQSGLLALGLGSYREAYNVLGLSLGVAPASINNYRDEFDPLFPNGRKGWHKRALRSYCERVYEEFGGYGLEEFTALIAKLSGIDFGQSEDTDEEVSAYAKRMLTGIAAENYFVKNFKQEEPFAKGTIRDMTRAGCGYDFSVVSPDVDDFLAVEVKGINDKSGGISMTEKEYDVASTFRKRFFLYVVTNMETTPLPITYEDPLHSKLAFKRTERNVRHTTWMTRIQA